MTLQEILDKVSTTNVNDLRLYFITRVLKDNIKKSAKIIDKYLFKVYQVDIDDEIRQYLYDLSIEQLDKVINLKSATPFPKCYLHKEEWTFDS